MNNSDLENKEENKKLIKIVLEILETDRSIISFRALQLSGREN